MIFNAILSLPIPVEGNTNDTILKPGKHPTDAKSYIPISLLLILSKICEKILLKRLKPLLEEKKLITSHYFSLRNQRVIMEEINNFAKKIRDNLEQKVTVLQLS